MVISGAEPTSDPLAKERELEKRVHGSSPTNRKTEYGIFDEALVGMRMIMEKAKDMTNIWASGFRITQKYPRIDCL